MRDLTGLFSPRSIAVVGVSSDPSAWGTALARTALAADPSRPMYLVNRRGATVLDRPTVRSLRALDTQVDLVALCVPVSGFLDAVDDALAVGAKAIVAVTAGLGELGAEGTAIERDAVERIRAAGAVLIGPNCMGVVDTSTRLSLASDPFVPGPVALLSQSGNLSIDTHAHLVDGGLGVSRMVSLGNQADVTLAELVRSCTAHDATQVIAIYAEDLRDGRQFAIECAAAHAAGTPVVLLSPGGSEAGARGAQSHTGALVTSAAVIDAVCNAGQIHRVGSVTELVDACVVLVQPRRLAGHRIVVFTDGGGHGALTADAGTAAGFALPALSAVLGESLRRALWDRAGTSNPVDLAGIGEQDPASYQRGLGVLLRSDEVDGVLMVGWFGGYATDGGWVGDAEIATASEIVELVSGQDKPVVVASMFPDTASTRILRDGGVPVFRETNDAVRAMRALVPVDATPLSALPKVATPIDDASYGVLRELLMAAGIRFAGGRVVAVADAGDAADDLGYPVVLKAVGLLHKSDAGGVRLDLASRREVESAASDFAQRLGATSVSVDEQIDTSEAVELIAGVRQDPRCGPVLLVGIGGVLTEVMRDTQCLLAPATATQVAAALRRLRGAALLDGVRGRSAVSVVAASELIAALSEFGAAHPELTELEINPLIVTPDDAIAVDVRAV